MGSPDQEDALVSHLMAPETPTNDPSSAGEFPQGNGAAGTEQFADCVSEADETEGTPDERACQAEGDGMDVDAVANISADIARASLDDRSSEDQTATNDNDPMVAVGAAEFPAAASRMPVQSNGYPAARHDEAEKSDAWGLVGGS